MYKIFANLVLLVLAGVLGLASYTIRQENAVRKQNVADLQKQVSLRLQENKFLSDRNDTLRVEVNNLRSSDSYFSYEEKARENYGLIGMNETYFILPRNEITAIPDVQGLLPDKKSVNNTSPFSIFRRNVAVPNGENNLLVNDTKTEPLKLESLDSHDKNKDSSKENNSSVVPVAPIPFQLESLQ